MKFGSFFGLVIFLFAFSSNAAVAQDLACKPNLIGEDICLVAERMANEMATQLPMTTPDGTTLTSIEANGSVVSISGSWKMSGDEFLEKLLPSPTTMSEFRLEGLKSTTRMACSAEPLAAFVGLGGELRYTYFTVDGDRIFEALVVHCD